MLLKINKQKKMFKIPKKTVEILLVCLLIGSLNVASGAKILFFQGMSSHSHRVALQPLANKLYENGHEVHFLSPIKPEVMNANITEFCPQLLRDANGKVLELLSSDALVLRRLNNRHFNGFFSSAFGAEMYSMCQSFNEATVSSADFQDWLQNIQNPQTKRFDLVITEHPLKEIAFCLAHHLKAKVIGISPSPTMVSMSDMLGWSPEMSWLPDMTVDALDTSSWPYAFFPEHFIREFNNIMWYFTYKWNYLPKVDALAKQVFKDDTMPPVEDLIKNMHLYLLNVHFSQDYATSLPPFVVSVAGMHTKGPSQIQPLNKNIEDFIEANGSEGFIYVSLGSYIRLSALPPALRKDMFNAFESFRKKNIAFLMKFTAERPDDLPENVFSYKWFSQQDVLAHPKCRGFVSQGGLISFQEATYHGVPLIIIPVLADQPYNAQTAVRLGTGIYIELADLSFGTFSEAIKQILYKESYKNKAHEVAQRFKDRPMTPLDTAVWWTEYVLRHNDTSQLKPMGIHQEWWQRRLLDFWAFVFTVTIVFVFAFVQIVCGILAVFRKSSDKVKSD